MKRQPSILSMFFSMLMITLMLWISCGKDDTLAGNNEAFTKNLPGTIYFYFAGKYGLIDFKANRYVEEYANSKLKGASIGDIYISRNGKNALVVSDKFSLYGNDAQRIVYRSLENPIRDLEDGKNIYSFVYRYGDIALGSGTWSSISPNEKFVAIDANSFAKHPLVLVDAKTGEVMESFKADNVDLRKHSIIDWTDDNSLFMNIGGDIFKVNAADNWTPQPLKHIASEGANVAVNRQGTKLVFRGTNKHLFLYDLQNGQVKQITTSKTDERLPSGERLPEFSPDGNYIAFSAKSTTAAHSWENPIDGSVVGVSGEFGYLAVIPADGKLYDLEKAGSGVIFPRNSENKIIAVDGKFYWR